MRVPRTDEKSTGTRDQGHGNDGDEKEGETCSPNGVLDCGVLWRDSMFLRCLGTGRGGWQVWQVEGAAETGAEGGGRVLWEPGRIVMGACSVRRSCRRRWRAKRPGCRLRAICSRVQPRGSSTPPARPSPSHLGVLLLACSHACFRKTVTALVSLMPSRRHSPPPGQLRTEVQTHGLQVPLILRRPQGSQWVEAGRGPQL